MQKRLSFRVDELPVFVYLWPLEAKRRVLPNKTIERVSDNFLLLLPGHLDGDGADGVRDLDTSKTRRRGRSAAGVVAVEESVSGSGVLEAEENSDGAGRKVVDFGGGRGVEEKEFGRSFGFGHAGIVQGRLGEVSWMRRKRRAYEQQFVAKGREGSLGKERKRRKRPTRVDADEGHPASLIVPHHFECQSDHPRIRHLDR